MAVVTSEFEITSSLPASKFFNAYRDFNNIAPKVDPETYKTLVTVEGDGDAGTIRDISFGDVVPFTSGKFKLDVVDSNNFNITYTIFEGDVLMGQLDSMTHHVKFIPSTDGGCVYKSTIVHNYKGETRLPEEHLNMAIEGFKKTFKAIEGFIHANPQTY